MFCTQCGHQLGEKDCFCSQCAHPTGVAGPRPAQPLRLTRDMQNKRVAGVCAGMARYLAIDVVLVRVIWLAVALCTGAGFIAYVVAWIMMPRDYQPPPFAATEFARQS